MTAWLVSIVIKSSAILLLAGGVAILLRRHSAAVRHLVWGVALAAVIALPLISVGLPWRIRALPAFDPPGQVDTPSLDPALPTVPAPLNVANETAVAPAVGRETIDDSRTLEASATPFRPSPMQIVLVTWLAGVLFACGRLLRGTAVVRRVLAQSTPLDTPDWTRPLFEAADRLGLSTAPDLVVSDRAPMPFACGVRRPILVMPSDAREWRDKRRRAVLSHELAHLRRHDLGMNALAQAACAMYWFHPLVWMAARRLRLEAERACDDLVLGIGTRASEYADHLLQIVCRAARMRAPVLALPLAQRREFEGRMLAILEPGVPRHASSPRMAATFAALALGLIVPLAALAPVAATSAGNQAVAVSTAPASAPAEVSRATGDTARLTPRPEGRAPLAKPVSSDTGALVSASSASSASSAAQDSVPRVVAALIRALEDTVGSVRLDATYALGQRRSFAALTGLGTRLTRDRSQEVREMAAWSLGQISSPNSSAVLGTAAKTDTARAVRAMAVWALGQIGDASAIPDLAAVLADRSPEIRGRAAWALGTIRATPAPDPLIAALRDSSAAVRYRAAWALGQIRDSRAVPGLSAAFKDGDSEVRGAALWAIGQMQGDAAQDALVEALSDSNSKVRAAAARALSGARSNPWPWPWPMPIHR